MPKVLCFVSPTVGGATRMSINVGKILMQQGFEVKFVVYSDKIQETKDFIPQGAEYTILGLKSIWHLPVLRMVRLFKKERATHVFSSLVFLNLRVIIAAKVAGVKSIVRNDNILQYFQPYIRTGMKLIYPIANHIITQQEEMREELVNFIPKCKDKIVALQNVFDSKLIDKNILAQSPYNDNATVRYVWSGRYTHSKGHDVLLKAFKIVHDANTGTHLYILGKFSENNPYYQRLKLFVQDNDITDFVHFVGFQKNPHVWIKYADCFVLPSRVEGLPNALVEAMYIGKPVVATVSIPVIDRMVEQGYNGYKVKVEDIDDMADKMMKALKLKDFKMTYKPSTPEDYIKLFD